MLWMWPPIKIVSAPVTGSLGKGPLVFSRYPISYPKVYYMAWCHTHSFKR